MRSLVDKYTWQCEAAFVAFVLAVVVLSTGNHFKEWVGSGAVFFSFMHAQIADRMKEKQAAMEKPSVECWPFLQRYFYTKEALWFVYFVLSETWSALVGVFVFMLYPLWRKYYGRLKENDYDPAI